MYIVCTERVLFIYFYFDVNRLQLRGFVKEFQEHSLSADDKTVVIIVNISILFIANDVEVKPIVIIGLLPLNTKATSCVHFFYARCNA